MKLTMKKNLRNTMIKKYIENLLESRTVTHLYHLSTSSYAKHIALEEYYTEIVNLIDEIVETYQGKYGIMKLELTTDFKNDINSVEYFEYLAQFVETIRSELPQDNFLQHQYDDVETLIYKTLYKLKYIS